MFLYLFSFVAFVSGFNKRCFLRGRCSMEMWCLDDMERDSWDWVGPPAWERACFNSPEWGGGSSPVKTEPPRLYCCCCVLCVVCVCVRACVVVVVLTFSTRESVLARANLCTKLRWQNTWESNSRRARHLGLDVRVDGGRKMLQIEAKTHLDAHAAKLSIDRRVSVYPLTNRTAGHAGNDLGISTITQKSV